MQTVFRIVRPLVWFALVVGVLRFILVAAGAPRWLVYTASLTGVELLGMLFLAFKIAHERTLGYRHLWLGNLIVFGLCQALTIGGMAYTYLSGKPTLYHETERLVDFLKYDPTPTQHIGMHVLNWMVIAPTIATWVTGAPIVYFLRRRLDR